MLSNKPEIDVLPLYLAYKESKTVLSGEVKEEVRSSLKTYDIALRRLFKLFEEKGKIDNPFAEFARDGIYNIAELEFFVAAVYHELEGLKDYSDKLKEQNELLRDMVYELKLENQTLKF